MSEKGNFIVMLDSIGCLIRVDEDNREWSHDEDEPLIRASDHHRIAAEQARRIEELVEAVHESRAVFQAAVDTMPPDPTGTLERLVQEHKARIARFDVLIAKHKGASNE